MTWPQYFEIKEGDNKYALEFSVHMIPTMWLVDKQGILRALRLPPGGYAGRGRVGQSGLGLSGPERLACCRTDGP